MFAISIAKIRPFYYESYLKQHKNCLKRYNY